jgi:A/G-specific adenine glycosylase
LASAVVPHFLRLAAAAELPSIAANSLADPVPDLTRIVDALLSWFALSRRDLPWRRSADPYSIWISEIMLQQTQVKTVIPYWERWMTELPTIEALANAPHERVLKLWEGLGYYHRARNLQRAATIIVTEEHARFPQDYDVVLALPGIGRYTAGAICSIAFNQPTPILDGNVMRVLARLFGTTGNVRTGQTNRRLWRTAADLVSTAGARRQGGKPCAELNQALMELGALICKPKQPECALCPVQYACVAYRIRRVDHLPNLGRRPTVTRRRFVAFVVCSRDRLLVRQRPEGVVNARLWEFPNVEITGDESLSPEELAAICLGAPFGPVIPLAVIHHTITRYRIRHDSYRVIARSGQRSTHSGVWLTRQQARELPFASAHLKILNKLPRE